jgi:hypothetical protein
MTRLARTESLFQACVLGTGMEIAEEICGPDGNFRASRLAIYRDAYRLRLIEVLASDYPALKSHSGEEFDAIAAGYVAAHPSTFRNVRWFGGALADFLRTDPRYRDRPELADLACFEWTLGLAFDAPDQPAVTFDDVAALSPEQWPELRFDAHPSLHVVSLRASAVAAWKAFSAGAPPAESDRKRIDWAVWRKDLAPYFRSLGPDEAWALQALRGGRNFGELCAGLCDWTDAASAAPRAAQLLRAWVDDGWIAALHAP